MINIALAISKDCAKVLEETANTFTHAPYFMSNNAHKGCLPKEMSFLELDAKSTVLSGVLPTEDGNVINVRFYENCGCDDKVTLKFAKTPVCAVSTDLTGKEGLIGKTIDKALADRGDDMKYYTVITFDAEAFNRPV